VPYATEWFANSLGQCSSHVKVMEGNKRKPGEVLSVSPRASHLDDQVAHLLEFCSYQPSPATISAIPVPEADPRAGGCAALHAARLSRCILMHAAGTLLAVTTARIQ
jgi:hypothetical protein